MNPLQQVKNSTLLFATVATNATASQRVDRLGFDYAVFNITMPAATATNSSAKWGALTITQGDSTAISSGTAVTALTGTTNTSTTSGFVIQPNNNTSNPQTHSLHVDCRGKGRYLFITYQGAASHQTAFASVDLYRGAQAPDSDTERNVALTVVG